MSSSRQGVINLYFNETLAFSTSKTVDHEVYWTYTIMGNCDFLHIQTTRCSQSVNVGHRWEFCHPPQLDLFTRGCAPLVLYVGTQIPSMLKPVHLMVCWICTIMEFPPHSKHSVLKLCHGWTLCHQKVCSTCTISRNAVLS